MRLIYFGTADFAVPALRRLGDRVCLVISQPDRPSGRGLKLQPSPVKLAAVEMELPVETPERCRAPEFVQRLRSEQADALIVAAYGQILSQKVLDSAIRGGINLHGSILPKYRGAAPIQRAILAGETETGVTLMQMDRGMDTGDMIEIARAPIGPDETYGEVATRLSQVAADLILAWIDQIVKGDYPRVPQDGALATHAAKIEKEEAELHFDRPALEEYNRFRAFTPAPGAFIRTRFGLVKCGSLARSEQPPTRRPGEIESVSPELTVAFSGGALVWREIQPEGKKRMTGRDFANGMRLTPGMSLRHE